MSRAIFLYDGDCAFCSSCGRFIERRIPTSARVEPWQSVDIESLDLTPAQCDAAVQWVGAGVAGRPGTALRLLATALLLLATAGLAGARSSRSRLVLAGAARSSRSRLAGPEAIAALLRSSSRPLWRGLGRLLGSRAGLLVAWPAYRWVSRNRHRLPGGTPACSVSARTRAGNVTLRNEGRDRD